jgi:hypothetical protein
VATSHSPALMGPRTATVELIATSVRLHSSRLAVRLRETEPPSPPESAAVLGDASLRPGRHRRADDDLHSGAFTIVARDHEIARAGSERVRCDRRPRDRGASRA